MSHGILIQSNVQSKNIDSLNRRAKGAVDLDNGNIVISTGASTVYGEGQVYTVTAPTSASPTGIWMVSEPEVVLTAGKYKGLDPDPRNFYIIAGDIFGISKVKINDLVRLTDDNFSNTRTTETYVNVVSGANKLAWNASKSAATAFQLIDVEPLPIATGQPGNNRVTTYKLEAIAE